MAGLSGDMALGTTPTARDRASCRPLIASGSRPGSVAAAPIDDVPTWIGDSSREQRASAPLGPERETREWRARGRRVWEVAVKGLGWPHRWSSRGGRGLGWPGASRHRHSEGEAAVAPEVDPPGGTAGYSRVPDDSRHVVHGSPSRVVITLPDDDDHVLSPVAAGPPGQSALGGWGGAAPAVTAVGLAWLDSVPRESAGDDVPPLADETPDLVVIRSPETGLEPDDERRPYAEARDGAGRARHHAGRPPTRSRPSTRTRRPQFRPIAATPRTTTPAWEGWTAASRRSRVSRETDEGVRLEGAAGALAQPDEEQRVSRETASTGRAGSCGPDHGEPRGRR